MRSLNVLALATGLLLAGCATPLPPLPAQPQPPARFREAARWTTAAPAEAQDRGAWWTVFRDASLDELLLRASEHNTQVQEAAARVTQARALVRSANADRLPQLTASTGATRAGGAAVTTGPSPATTSQAGAQLRWEVDLFGRLGATRDAAALDADAREALLQNTRLLVQAETAQTYFALRALDAEGRLVRETIDAYAATLRLTQRRYQAGDVGELDVRRVETEVAATQADALDIQRRRAALEHALAVLVGDSASEFTVPAGDWVAAIPAIPPGIPATVLTRRADVSAAQTSLLAAQARVGIAQSAWFPRLALTTDGGFASLELGDLLRWSARAWTVEALLSLPIFDGGRRAAGVQEAQGRLDEALAQYRGKVLVAFAEVEDQLSALQLLGEQANVQQRAVDAARRATTLSDIRYREGMVSQLELLDARRSELQNRRAALRVRAGQFDATVGLVRALGGGWGPSPGATAALPSTAS